MTQPAWRLWGAFGLLTLAWGSSFLWIKIGVAEIGPLTLVALRLLFGLAGLALISLWQKPVWPREGRVWLAYGVMSLINTAIPFSLFAWGETRISSALASILNGTVPLFAIVIAHFWQADDKITLPRLGGLALGFVGLVFLVGGDLQLDTSANNLLGAGAVLGATFCYALALNFARKYLRQQPPVTQALLTVFFSAVVMSVAAPIFEAPLRLPVLPITWLAAAWLGLLGSCLAYVLFFYLVTHWGPTRSSLVTYVMPIVGVALGLIFLNEPAHWSLLIGTVLVLAGVGVINWVKK